MLQPGGDPYLAEEPIGADVAELGTQHLERDETIVAEVANKVDRRHAAAAELANGRVAGSECVEQWESHWGHAPTGPETNLRAGTHWRHLVPTAAEMARRLYI
jgi:hypothetical protein